MDEVLFRSSQKLENLQVQFSLAKAKSKDVFHELSQESKSLARQLWNSSNSKQIRDYFKDCWVVIVNLCQELQEKALRTIDIQKIYRNFMKFLWGKWTKRDFYCLSLGFFCGIIIGIAIAATFRGKQPIPHYMQAVQCLEYLGPESVHVVEDAIAPFECKDKQVLINVKAASIQTIDLKICNGYGKLFRRILRGLHGESTKGGLPVTLGRDCTGIITDVGANVKRLEIGDEVWLAVPFWAQGTLSQSFLINENKVGRKPHNIGFEGACSLPYAGNLALYALKSANIKRDNAKDKRILVQGCCTPVGCILVQILKVWEAHITVTCFKKTEPVAKALGASDVIVLDQENKQKCLQKALEFKDLFDIIINTQDCELTETQLKSYVTPVNGVVISTLPPILMSDSCNFFFKFLLTTFVRLKFYFEKLLGIPCENFDETHMCYVTLDEIAEMVEKGHLQTVVDKVFQPQNINIALNHIQSLDSIGSTVITFR